MKSLLIKFSALGIFVSFLSVGVAKVDAAYLYMDPSQKAVKIGDEFDVIIKINTEGEKPTTADALIQFDDSTLTLVDVIQGSAATSFFPQMIKQITGSKIYIGSYINLGSEPKSGDGIIATVRFRGKSQAQANVKFLCTDGLSTDSNISLKRNGKVIDAVECSKVVSGTYMVSATGSSVPTAIPTPTSTGGAGGTAVTPTVTSVPTNTPTPTLAPTATPNPVTPTVVVPSVLPQTGVFETTGIIILMGVTLTVISILIKTYVS